MMEAEKAKASLTSYKGHFTRQKRAFDRRLDELHPEVAENWGMLDSAFKKYLKWYGNFLCCCTIVGCKPRL